MGITLSEMGGAQKVVYDLISSLSKNRYDITLVTCLGGELIQWIKELKHQKDVEVRVIEIPQMRREISPFYDLWALIKLYILMKREKYDISHFHSSKMGILGRFAAYMAGIPAIYFTVHGWGINEYQPKWVQKMLGFAERIAGLRCTMCVCVSKYVMDIGIKKGWLRPAKASVIYSGIDVAPAVKDKLRNELNIDDNTIIIGTIMRLLEPKQPVYTIEVFNEVLRKGYRAKLVIIGDGPLDQECRTTIQKLGIENDVYMLGTRTDARELINDIDIFTMFSKWEGLPISIIEAMFAGKPVVTSRVGGIPELIDHGINGYMVNSFNTYEAAGYICNLIENEKLRKNMGKAGKQKAIQQFTKSRMVQSYEKIYNGIYQA